MVWHLAWDNDMPCHCPSTGAATCLASPLLPGEHALRRERNCRHCWVDSEAIANGWGPKAFCPTDEHYIPTLLASKGLDNETDCTVRALLYHCLVCHSVPY